MSTSGNGGSVWPTRMSVSPLTSIATERGLAWARTREYSGTARSNNVWSNRCPRDQRSTGMGINNFPMDAYAGRRRLMPPEWSMSFRFDFSQSLKFRPAPVLRHASTSKFAVPPPEPSGGPLESEQANQCGRGRPSRDSNSRAIGGGSVRRNWIESGDVVIVCWNDGETAGGVSSGDWAAGNGKRK